MGQPDPASPLEHHRLPAVDQHPIFEVMRQRPREHAPFDVAALAHEVVGGVAVRDALDVLLDDRTLVEIGGDEMRGGADQFDAARVRLMIGFGALEAGQERVVDVDAAPAQLGREPVR